ncbi:hypothetical protein E2C01_093609 [Portunus trituberculatus]|uniref:Uncharacterized protein n=1 Tax=Portunus trituberculatus TaxID=210409 RepID=A0A5B7JU02_PORTR|nr:hypothetical protein [Portunus trituberculatus]
MQTNHEQEVNKPQQEARQEDKKTCSDERQVGWERDGGEERRHVKIVAVPCGVQDKAGSSPTFKQPKTTSTTTTSETSLTAT